MKIYLLTTKICTTLLLSQAIIKNALNLATFVIQTIPFDDNDQYAEDNPKLYQLKLR